MAGFLDRLREVVLGCKTDDSNGTAPALLIKVRCKSCGEEITTRVEKAQALQEQYEMTTGDDGEEPEVTGYLLQKEILGAKCQALLQLTMKFDTCTRPLKHEVIGGELLEVRDSE
ncbi:MAG TPA: hypothetical protein VGM19_11100 [Armatimonadota bacterium]|jgi:hypothetical protein